MDLRYTQDEQKFRNELASWLASEVPAHGSPPSTHDWDARRVYDTSWQRKLFDAGYAGINWPKEYGGRDASLADLRRGARRLHDADVVHLQWKLADWDPRWGGVPRMEVVLRSLRRPLVVTMHDVFERHGRWQRQLSPSALGLRRLAHNARRLVVHSEEERERLRGLVPDHKLEVVPHFVEVRTTLPATREAISSPAGRSAVFCLGW